MRSFGKWLGRLLVALIVVIGGLWIVGPYEDVDLDVTFDPAALGDNPEAYFALQEAQFDDITEGVQKRVIWAGDAGVKTDLSIVYIHGFSATSEEIRPVPDRVAAQLGANLIFTRLQGHGRGGPAMAEASVSSWMTDVAEALAAARLIGEQVIVLSTSTGGTLVAAAAQDKVLMDKVAGLVFVAPNFGINNSAAPMLTFPAARYWLPMLVGDTRSFEPLNDAQELYWTTQYPAVAVFPMAALVKAVRELAHEKVDVPALFFFSDDDTVVEPAATRDVASRWGGPVHIVTPDLGPEDDPSAHVIAGDIVSPDQTEFASQAILDWIKGL